MEDKSLESLTKNDLEPKLPWMKVGDRISQFGHGYSKML